MKKGILCLALSCVFCPILWRLYYDKIWIWRNPVTKLISMRTPCPVTDVLPLPDTEL